MKQRFTSTNPKQSKLIGGRSIHGGFAVGLTAVLMVFGTCADTGVTYADRGQTVAGDINWAPSVVDPTVLAIKNAPKVVMPTVGRSFSRSALLKQPLQVPGLTDGAKPTGEWTNPAWKEQEQASTAAELGASGVIGVVNATNGVLSIPDAVGRYWDYVEDVGGKAWDEVDSWGYSIPGYRQPTTGVIRPIVSAVNGAAHKGYNAIVKGYKMPEWVPVIGGTHAAGTNDVASALKAGQQTLVENVPAFQQAAKAGDEAQPVFTNLKQGNVGEAAKVVVNNPKMVANLALQNLPQFAATYYVKAATGLNSAVGYAMMQEAGSAASTLTDFEKETGVQVNPVLSANIVTGVGVGAGGLEVLGMEGATSSFLKKIVLAPLKSVVEGGTEVAQTGIENAANQVYDPRVSLEQGMGAALVGGGATPHAHSALATTYNLASAGVPGAVQGAVSGVVGLTGTLANAASTEAGRLKAAAQGWAEDTLAVLGEGLVSANGAPTDGFNWQSNDESVARRFEPGTFDPRNAPTILAMAGKGDEGGGGEGGTPPGHQGGCFTEETLVDGYLEASVRDLRLKYEWQAYLAKHKNEDNSWVNEWKAVPGWPGWLQGMVPISLIQTGDRVNAPENPKPLPLDVVVAQQEKEWGLTDDGQLLDAPVVVADAQWFTVLGETKGGLPVEFQIRNQMRVDAKIIPGAVVKIDIPGIATRGAIRILNVYEDELKDGHMTWGSVRTKAKMPAPVTEI